MDLTKAYADLNFRVIIIMFCAALAGLCPLFYLWGVMSGSNESPTIFRLIALTWVMGPPFAIVLFTSVTAKYPKDCFKRSSFTLKERVFSIVAALWTVGMWSLGFYCTRAITDLLEVSFSPFSF